MRILFAILLILPLSTVFTQKAHSYEYYVAMHDEDISIPWKESKLKPYTFTFTLDTRSIFKASGSIGVRHNGHPVWGHAVNVGLKLRLHRENKPEGSWIDHSGSSTNIPDKLAHYGILPVDAHKVLNPGEYKVTLWMEAQSDKSPDTDGLASTRKRKSKIIYEIIKCPKCEK